MIEEHFCPVLAIAKAIRAPEAQLARAIVGVVEPALLGEWWSILPRTCESGAMAQRRLWAGPAMHSCRQIEEVLERVHRLRQRGSSGTCGLVAIEPAPGARRRTPGAGEAVELMATYSRADRLAWISTAH